MIYKLLKSDTYNKISVVFIEFPPPNSIILLHIFQKYTWHLNKKLDILFQTRKWLENIVLFQFELQAMQVASESLVMMQRRKIINFWHIATCKFTEVPFTLFTLSLISVAVNSTSRCRRLLNICPVWSTITRRKVYAVIGMRFGNLSNQHLK